MERGLGALMRAILVALLLALPSLLLPGQRWADAPLAELLALSAAIFTFLEYGATAPSLVEFRGAAPVNRLRFITLFVLVLAVTLLFRHSVAPGAVTGLVAQAAQALRPWADLPVASLLPASLGAIPIDLREEMALAAALSFGLMAVLIVHMLAAIWLAPWSAPRNFNLWINLPLFTATRLAPASALYRSAGLSLLGALCFPVFAPLAVDMLVPIVDPHAFNDPQTTIWAITLWAFIPANLLMRATALLRVARYLGRGDAPRAWSDWFVPGA
ncbi:hypothetical protein SAMN05421688_2703 [Poseidonocella pacifica]|uniref:Uncharacterized protein n=1 Tax=Poseidonocella pacifica TaxID=871651 RepID=A0A1I0Y3G2_9RHOB|nr:hypothetical protein [Poseidonocella pacifica]SFB06753.1 hypothetical protein SAMN05421688_2703 [Poseidonocella pacifica]